MSVKNALLAYRDSLFDAAVLSAQSRIGARSLPIFGGFTSNLKLAGNGLWRPFKVTGALLFGYSGAEDRPFPAMPVVPEAFKGTDLEKAFVDSWKLKEQSARASINGFAKLMKLDISGWWQEASVTRYAEAKDANVVFVDEAQARQASNAIAAGLAGGSFVDMVSRGSGAGRSL